MSELIVARQGWRLQLTMNRPDRLNAVTETLYEALVAALAEADRDDAVRVVVLRGAGRAFCVGADLKDHGVAERGEDEKRRYAQFGQDAAAAIMECSKPVVAAVNGHAIGAGLELALCCDLSVVADDAKLRFPEFGLGTFVGGGTTFTLVERVGMTKARELLLLGRFFRGADAAAWGVCNEAAPAADVPARAEALADEVAAKAPRSVAHCKRLLRRARELSNAQLLEAERDALASCMGTPDWREGIAAFREKR
ncbi:MAG: enoyl-CoA hydratase/isomerase family protein, partial [Planctomycetes bacterium]|nr:enoyl-CoA hydratase/isomerase family protein [Planctomycetota bacterium]